MEQFIEQFTREQILPSLADFIRIPNLSPQFDPQWLENGLLDKACNHIVTWIESQSIPNCKVEVLSIKGAPKAIHVRICAQNPITVFYYGHYDKQPHFPGWREGFGPTTPVIEGHRMYGRGVADDGYAPYAAIAALQTLISQKLEHPTIEMLFEGEEESGSNFLMQYFDKLELKRVDIMVALDSGSGDYERLWLTSSLRGSMKIDLCVKVLEAPISSDESGIVPQALNIMRTLLNRLEDPVTGQVHKSLQTIIPADRYEECLLSADLVQIEFSRQCDKMESCKIQQYINRNWKPSVSYIGQDGLPSVRQINDQIIPELIIRLSIRLPPNKCAKEAAIFVKQLLEKDPPFNADVKANIISAGTGLNINSFSPKLKDILNTASKLFFNDKESRVFHEGASIPFLNQLNERSPQAEFLVLGVLGPDSNAHGANEMLDLNYMKGLIGCLAYTMNQFIKQ
ncbi:unnamed protein product (macronuclear) [Paramecium tetraurelia]|uniref:Peptidase M20 dimerisation domain-containing protein n=1 Tax=Paramecium tetraurelia TaxID=5888 RepID=A0C3B0_PARTE|nr:uncharacterized protein GSPATT00034756001 [Paramecium tetraurelia]CAK65277.1 unnamed protein product [Paramecium tetraurelia]|eukprot:XP_001432674.1 hypothetical protein (macronuclear) [Paramecium tetraurelia strain d4-2]